MTKDVAIVLLIDCPWCGERAESEFRCGGESHIERPSEPQAADDEQWADYLFYRRNAKDISYERWHHRFGCRRWFNIARDPVSHRIVAVYAMGDPGPALDEGRRR